MSNLPAPADDATPDAVLVVAAILGDVASFDVLVRRYRAAVWRMARHVVGADEADDVAQEAWLTAFRALPSVEEPERFGAWLMVLTRRLALRWRKRSARRRSRHSPLDTLLLDQLPELAVPPPVLDERRLAIDAALQAIPPMYALPIRLHYLDELPQRRVASVLDVPVSTVKWRIHHGKTLLRHHLDLMN
ncbi:MAG: sigma-70 family RNA polymerase sigma factor [Bacteroidota bacterium]